jgi:hypothetical protein
VEEEVKGGKGGVEGEVKGGGRLKGKGKRKRKGRERFFTPFMKRRE